MFHATLTGTIFLYQGQELGMINIPDSWGFSEYKDIEAIQNMERERTVFASRGLEGQKDLAVSLHSLRMTARDNSRTPMQVRHNTRPIADV
jgi:oligo-1,6-glucosidase